MLSDYFRTERYQFPELKPEQKQRAKTLFDLKRKGLPKDAFAYIGVTKEMLGDYIFKGVIDTYKKDEGWWILRNKKYIDKELLPKKSNYDPIQLATQDAQGLARVGSILGRLHLFMDIHFDAVYRILNNQTHKFIDINKEYKLLEECGINKEALDTAIKFSANNKGLVLALSEDVLKDGGNLILKDYDPTEERFRLGEGFNFKHVIGMSEPKGEEKAFFEGLERKV